MSANLPAFPSHGSMGEVVETGLTKRELFAAMAMQGLLANPFYAKEIRDNEWGMSAAAQSVFQADALLAELAKGAP